jgi:hypothetical protein
MKKNIKENLHIGWEDDVPKYYDTTKLNNNYITLTQLLDNKIDVNTVLQLLGQTHNYYTPDIDDIFQGYELEISNTKSVWEKHTFDLKDTALLKYCHYRTKYLDVADIEIQGWKYIETHDGVLYFDKTDLVLNYCPQNHILDIKQVSYLRVLGLYYGKCKSANEFDKLHKWIEI